MKATEVPVSVTPEAAARVAELGMQAPYEALLDYARAVSGVRLIEVTLNERYDTGDEPGVSIEAFVTGDEDTCNELDRRCASWYVQAFPPEVCEHFLMTVSPEAWHAG
jgi:hypothetical protein